MDYNVFALEGKNSSLMLRTKPMGLQDGFFSLYSLSFLLPLPLSPSVLIDLQGPGCCLWAFLRELLS